MQQYLNLMEDVLLEGERVKVRNGYTREIFGRSITYKNIGEQFPIVTTKKFPFRVMLSELICFIRGYSNVKEFQKMGCQIWDQNAYSEYWRSNPNYTPNSLGRIYGVQWRGWRTTVDDKVYGDNFSRYIDQLGDMIKNIKRDPFSRRHIVTAWNPGEIEEMCLPPCHLMFQVNITPSGKLNLMFYQRSCDLFLGVPFNVASYASLMLILCHQTGYAPGNLTHHMGSVHIYETHLTAVKEQLNREPLGLPKVVLEADAEWSLEDFGVMDFKFDTEYCYHPAIKAPMSV